MFLWQDLNAKKVKRSAAPDATTLFQTAKHSIKARFCTDVDFTEPDSTEDLLEQLKEYQFNAISINNLSIFLACMMGRNLDIIHQRYKDMNIPIKKFLADVHTYLPDKQFSKGQIYFLINLFKLANEYNKVMYISANIMGHLKTRFASFSQLVKADGEWWKGVPVSE